MASYSSSAGVRPARAFDARRESALAHRAKHARTYLFIDPGWIQGLLRPDRCAQPDRPGLHARDRQDAALPRVVCESGPDQRLAIAIDDEQSVFTVDIAQGAAEDDEALRDECIHERRVLVPPDLFPPALRFIPRRPARELDHEVIGGGAVGPPLVRRDPVTRQLQLPRRKSAIPSSAAPRAGKR